MSRYAEVIVDLAAAQIDHVFTYRIPEGMALQPGQRVEVPFRAHTLEGFVVGLTDETNVDPAVIKDVIEPIEDYPVILPELIDLARWMQQRYHCCLVDGLRLMIPAQMRGGRVGIKRIEVATLLISGDELDEFVRRNRRAKKRLEVIDCLKQGPKPVPLLNSIAPGAAKKLSEMGVVRIESDDVRRVPYTGLSSTRQEDPVLVKAQADALDTLTEAADHGGGRFLIHGVTGSGKTEVYIRLVRHALQSGKGAIILVPEISLTPQMVDWFRARFGDNAAVLHSRLSAGERFDEWRRIRTGQAKVVIGARSAVFAPVSPLGAIIIDEEHESSYQAGGRPGYDAREIADWRCRRDGAVMLLGSATPSIATYMKCMPGVREVNRIRLIEMPRRINGQPLPEVEIIDMRDELVRGNKSIFSMRLVEGMTAALSEGRQVILFINRRGHSTFVSCRSCGYVERCAQCDVSMTYHQWDGLLHCHYCGSVRRPPDTCPVCGSRFIRYFGVGTQKVEEEVHRRFPGVATSRMDVDTTGTKDAHEKIISSFRQGQSQVLIGTQMIAKGLDFPNVTLVGIVAADLSLQVPDYRSVERTFQLITQVSGRAGRAEHPGRVILQTYDPEHYGIQLAARQDYRAFYLQEVKMRRRGLYPPFTVLARLLVSSKDEPDARSVAEEIAGRFNESLSAHDTWQSCVVQTRALEAPLKILRGEYRWQVFAKLYNRPEASDIVQEMERLGHVDHGGVRVELEVNPSAML
ncbi:MAG: primosomal protein N' [Clostridia bacterium]|nr:primosomal protein N' [Clostridia bacterium]